jgi:DNA-binding NtrC family response regulator
VTDRLVSRRHAAVEIGDRGLRLTDLGSLNGTRVDSLHVVDAFLRGGETIRIGETSIRVEAIADASTPALSTALRFGRLVGASPEMRRLYPLCERLAASDIPVVIEGETGTGKEVLAEALHDASARASGPFVVFDCTAVPGTLLEAALFGHERGAFTGAVDQRVGVFEQANGGTLLIDEIGELDIALQPKLLRALERSEVQRVGSSTWTRVDVRVLAATRRDLDREVQAGRFRDDLFYRLAVGRIELPPLRSRRGDVAVLTRHLWRALGGDERPMPAGMLARFEDYAWPGNIRELANAVARVLALGELADHEEAGLASTSEREQAGVASTESIPPPAGDAIERVLELELPLTRARERIVEDFERRYVARVLKRFDGNVVRAAAASGIARRYFQILRARRAR